MPFIGEKLIPSDKYIMEESVINEYSLQMNLTILNLDKRDFGGYTCTSVNALGKAEGVVRLQGKDFKSFLKINAMIYSVFRSSLCVCDIPRNLFSDFSAENLAT